MVIKTPHEVDEVDIIRLVDLFQNHILNRYIPPNVSNTDPPPAVIMKMDIEGEEYIVLDDMLTTTGQESLCSLAAFSIEFHTNVNNVHKPLTKPNTLLSQQIMNSLDQYKRNHQSENDRKCHFDVILYDSEDHYDDSSAGKQKLNQWCYRLQFTTTMRPSYCSAVLKSHVKKSGFGSVSRINN